MKAAAAMELELPLPSAMNIIISNRRSFQDSFLICTHLDKIAKGKHHKPRQTNRINQQDLCNKLARLCSGLGCKFRKYVVQEKKKAESESRSIWFSLKQRLPVATKHYPGPAPPRITKCKPLIEGHLYQDQTLSRNGYGAAPALRGPRATRGYKLISLLPLSSQHLDLPVISSHMLYVQIFFLPCSVLLEEGYDLTCLN